MAHGLSMDHRVLHTLACSETETWLTAVVRISTTHGSKNMKERSYHVYDHVCIARVSTTKSNPPLTTAWKPHGVYRSMPGLRQLDS